MALAAEIGDGWLPMFFSPKADGFYREALAEGFARPGARRTADDFEVACVVPIDHRRRRRGAAPTCCGRRSRSTSAGMGARDRNFHFDVFARLGYEDACDEDPGRLPRRPQGRGRRLRAHRDGRGRYLIGPKEKVRDDLEAWQQTCLTTMLVSGPPQLLEEIAELVG